MSDQTFSECRPTPSSADLFPPPPHTHTRARASPFLSSALGCTVTPIVKDKDCFVCCWNVLELRKLSEREKEERNSEKQGTFNPSETQTIFKVQLSSDLFFHFSCTSLFASACWLWSSCKAINLIYTSCATLGFGTTAKVAVSGCRLFIGKSFLFLLNRNAGANECGWWRSR